jgi:hypothetical protein
MTALARQQFLRPRRSRDEVQLQTEINHLQQKGGTYAEAPSCSAPSAACNLAKNKFGLVEFENWIAVLRGVNLAWTGTVA